MKNLLIYLSITLSLISCGQSNSSYTAHDNTLGSEQFDNSISSINSIEISNSSSNITWDHSYTLTLSGVLSDPAFIPMLDTTISKTDLDQLECSNFNSLNHNQKIAFYIVFIAAIAEAESDFDTNNETLYIGDGTLNVGLLQIDRASSLRHARYLGTISDSDLKKPEVNLEVGARILKNQVMGGLGGNRSDVKGKLLTSKSYYWEVLTNNKRVKNTFKSNIKKLEFCKV